MDYKKQFKKKIKHYYLLKELSKNLYLSYDEKSKKLCSIKMLPKNIEKNMMLKLKNDVDFFIKIHNDNLINLISIEVTSNNIYLIYEYCNGGNLKNFFDFYKKIYKSNINLKLVQKIFLQIISGMEFLHKNNRIHGLLSLENISINFDKYQNAENNGLINEEINLPKDLLNEPFTIKIKNLICQNDKEEILKDINITKNISPEIAKYIHDYNDYQNLNFTKESDIWSLGAILYELIIGEPAFNGENSKEIIDKIIIGKYNFPFEFSQLIDVISFINGFLQYFPKKRFNFDKMREHNFLKKNPKDFFKINNFNEEMEKNLEINTKDCEYILWGLLNLKKSKSNLIDSNQNQKDEEEKINKNEENEKIEKNEDINIKEKINIDINEEKREENKKIMKNNINLEKNKIPIIKNKVKIDCNSEFEIINKYDDKKVNQKTKLKQSSFIEI